MQPASQHPAKRGNYDQRVTGNAPLLIPNFVNQSCLRTKMRSQAEENAGGRLQAAPAEAASRILSHCEWKSGVLCIYIYIYVHTHTSTL